MDGHPLNSTVSTTTVGACALKSHAIPMQGFGFLCHKGPGTPLGRVVSLSSHVQHGAAAYSYLPQLAQALELGLDLTMALPMSFMHPSHA